MSAHIHRCVQLFSLYTDRVPTFPMRLSIEIIIKTLRHTHVPDFIRQGLGKIKHQSWTVKKITLLCFQYTAYEAPPLYFKELNPYFSSWVLTSPGRPSSNSTRATGLLDTCPLLADVCRSTLHFRPLRPGSQRLWASRLSRTRVRWAFQKRARAAACSGVTPLPPCLRVCAVRNASSCAWSMSADAMD